MKANPLPITTADRFIREHQSKHPNSHFFDRDTLKFFGERRSDMYLHKEPVTITDVSGERHTCYVLSSVQRNYPSSKRRVWHYFDIKTLEQVIKE